MSTQAHVQIVKDLFAAMGRGDLQAVRALTADDVEWVVPGEWAQAVARAAGNVGANQV
jgi:ketosteroid isomerase-like protein